MATIVDALLIKFGFDMSEARQGAKEVESLTAKTTDAMKAGGKKMEESAKSSADFFSRLRGEVLLLFAAFTGGRSIKQFAADLETTSAAAGRFARLIGATTGEVGKWTTAGEAMGGSAGSITGSLQSLNNALQQISLTGQSSVLPYLRALNINLQDGAGHIKNATQLLPELHKALSSIAATDPARAAAIGHGLGLSDDMINVLIASDEQFNKMMADAARWGQVTDDQAKKAQALQYSWRGVTASFETLGRIVMTHLAPALTKVNEYLTDIFVWFQKHPDQLRFAVAELTVALTGLSVALAIPVMGTMLLIAALTAAGAAVFLLYDDWKTWMEGGKSAFGDFYQYVADHWNDIKGVVTDVLAELKKLWSDYTHAISDELKFFMALFFGSADDIRNSWKKVVEDIKTFWSDVWDDMIKVVENFGPKLYDAAKSALGATGKYIKGRLKAWFGIDTPDEDESSTSAGTGVGGAGGSAAGGLVGGGLAALGTPTTSDIESAKRGIAAIESGGRYDALGPVQKNGDRALGKYQVMASNVAAWTKQALGHALTPEQFLASPEAQEKVFEDQFGRNMKLYGPADAASIWFSGRRLSQAGNASDSLGTTVPVYVAKFMRTYNAAEQQRKTAQLDSYAAVNQALKTAPHNDNYAAGAPSSAEILAYNERSQNIHSEVKTGDIHVHTAATDAKGIVKDIKPELEKGLYGNAANYGYR